MTAPVNIIERSQAAILAGGVVRVAAQKFRVRAGSFFLIVLPILLLPLCPWVSPARAQQAGPPLLDYSRNPPVFPQVLAPYRSRKIPKPDFRNSPVVSQMIHDGKLELTVAQF